VADQALITRTLVELADTLVDDYDLIEFVQRFTTRCVDLLDVSEAGVILRRPGGELEVLASSSELARFVELIEVQVDDGPCLEAWRDGAVVHGHRLRDCGDRWPRFAPLALEAGFESAYGIPMRVRGAHIGALNLFADAPDRLTPDREELAVALADIASIGITNAWSLEREATLSEQLQHALDSRVVIEQAKGILAAHAQVPVDEAFGVLRAYARAHNRRLTEVADDVVHSRLGARELGAATPPPPPRAVPSDREPA
jgi:GAF domain-containing protein